MPGQADDAAGVQSPAQADPDASPLSSAPPLFSEQGWDRGSPSSLHPAGLGSGLSAPAAAASPEDPAASLWASPRPGPGTPPQHPVSPSPRKTRARPLRQREDGSGPLPAPLPQWGAAPFGPRDLPQTPPPNLLGAHTGPRPRLSSRALMNAEPGLGPDGRCPAFRSCSRIWPVRKLSVMVVVMTPVGPRFTQPLQ